MKPVRIGFHLLMLALLIMAFSGVFSPPRTGNFAADNGGFILPAIGIVAIWIVGAIILRVVGQSSRS
jgi:hypothetical protein